VPSGPDGLFKVGCEHDAVSAIALGGVERVVSRANGGLPLRLLVDGRRHTHAHRAAQGMTAGQVVAKRIHRLAQALGER